MSDPINFTPSAAASYSSESNPEPLECRANVREAPAPLAAPEPGTQMLVDQYTRGGAGNGSSSSAAGDKSCLAPLLSTVGSCGVIALTEGSVALLAGAQCAGSALALFDCAFEDARKSKP